MVGKLTVITGPMFAGKSTELLKRILPLYNDHWSRKNLLVLKPNIDNRYSESEIVSHDGLRAPATNITEDINLSDYYDIFIDEVQFLEEPYFKNDIINMIRVALYTGRHVTASALNTDWSGQPFKITGALLAMADEIIHLKANCTICGQPASKTLKKVVDLDVDDPTLIELGSTDKYEARCNLHWGYANQTTKRTDLSS